jgi:hypothetical protein
METTLISLIALSALATLTSLPVHGSACSVNTLNGTYLITAGGYALPGREGIAQQYSVPLVVAGTVAFDGAGGLIANYTEGEGGRILSAGPDSGAYSVNSDCTGSFTDSTIGVTFNMAIIGGGTEVFATSTYDPAVVSLKKQSVPAGGCSSVSLMGAYAFNYSAFVSPGSATNFVPKATHAAATGVLSFDGAGNLPAITYTLNSGGNVNVASADTGSYTVNSDCTGSFTDAAVGIHFNIVIIGGGKELVAIQTDGGFAALLAAKKQ